MTLATLPASALALKSEASAKTGLRPLTEPRCCLDCLIPLVKRPNESYAEFNGRHFCSRKCRMASAAKQRQAEGKTCALCGAKFHRTPELSHAKWEKRRTCSSACGAVWAAKTRWAGHVPKRSEARQRVLDAFKAKGGAASALARRRIELAPKGPMESVESYFARGGTVTRVERSAVPDLAGLPVWPTYPNRRSGGA